MKGNYSKLLVLIMLLIASSIASPTGEIELEIRNPNNTQACRDKCSNNQICKNNSCVCIDGFYKPDEEENNCVKSYCKDGCDEITQVCVGDKCVCKSGYSTDKDPGTKLNCVQNTVNMPPVTSSTTTTTKLPPPITTTTTGNQKDTTLPKNATITTNSKPTTMTLQTKATATTTVKPSIPTVTQTSTTSTTTPKPSPQPAKSSMSPWTVTAIIFIVAGLAGLGGYMIYKHKSRGSYRAASTVAQ